MKTYMLWIPGKIIGVWTTPKEAREHIIEYADENPKNIAVMKVTVYDKSFERGAQAEMSVTGPEVLELFKNGS
jgi:hypothetical protein